MRKKVYLETSVISYLTARVSRDLIVAAHQQITQEWWENERTHYDVFISELVVQEAQKGDRDAVKKRLALLKPMKRLLVNEHVIHLAEQIIEKRVLPASAMDDILHIAIAAIHRMDYLLTWNCKHIANAQIQKTITRIIEQQGYESPVMCTPEELVED